MDPARLGAREAARLIALGELTALALTEACLARIEAHESRVRAWAHVDPDAALSQARACDANGTTAPLHGVPVGLKDIIDTADMPTEYGSPIYRGHRPKRDAECVARIRAAGGVILGKTVTTEFAFRHPFGPTTNPHNAAHTPGGSSSGSAAAVADSMTPLALGTQTGGSIIRPGAFCGAYAYKPSYGTFSFDGIKQLAPGLDTLGPFARSVDDLAWFAAALSTGCAWPVPEQDTPPRIGLARTHDWASAQAETVQAVETAAARLADAGARVHEAVPPKRFAALGDAHQTIMHYEAAKSLVWERQHHQANLSETLREILAAAVEISSDRYEQALSLARACRGHLDALFGDSHVLLTASAPGEAPMGLQSTGSAMFNRVWTLLHVPCVTLPAAKGPHGLPVGIQLVGRPGGDSQLMSVAQWVAIRLGL